MPGLMATLQRPRQLGQFRPLLVLLFTKLPNACTETSFFSGPSDCENAGRTAEAMPKIHVTAIFFLNISLLPLYSTPAFLAGTSVRSIPGTRDSTRAG